MVCFFSIRSKTVCFCSGPDVLILTSNRLKPVKEKSIMKTKLTPVTGSVKVSTKGKNNRQRNTTAVTLDDIFDNDDDDDIQGDASGITVPISKSLGNKFLMIHTRLNPIKILSWIFFSVFRFDFFPSFFFVNLCAHQQISKTAKKL